MSDRTDVPASKRATARYPEVRALCCECGQLRRSSTYGSNGEPAAHVVDLYHSHGWEVPTRCTVFRKCANCQRETEHALLRDDLTPAERAERERPLSEKLSPLVASEVEQLEACGVRVQWEPETRWKSGQVAVVTQWLDDNTWQVELNSDAHVVHLAGALEAAWSLLTTAGADLGRDGWRSTSGTPGDPDDPPRRYRMIHL